jgi:hypothetical protein
MPPLSLGRRDPAAPTHCEEIIGHWSPVIWKEKSHLFMVISVWNPPKFAKNPEIIGISTDPGHNTLYIDAILLIFLKCSIDLSFS